MSNTHWIEIAHAHLYSAFNPQPADFDRLFLNNNKPYPHITLQLIGPPYNLDNCKISHPFDCLILRYKDFLFFEFLKNSIFDFLVTLNIFSPQQHVVLPWNFPDN
jgi:hypothetical protein